MWNDFSHSLVLNGYKMEIKITVKRERNKRRGKGVDVIMNSNHCDRKKYWLQHRMRDWCSKEKT